MDEKYMKQIDTLLECYNADRCATFNFMNYDFNELMLMRGRNELGKLTENDKNQLDILADSMKCHCEHCRRYKERILGQ